MALITRNLLDMAGLSGKNDYKPLRQKEIQKSEVHVTKIIDVLENDYWSPFSVFLEEEEVYNLSSGKKYNGDVSKLIDIKKQGQLLMDTFWNERIQSGKTPFHAPIHKQTPTLFKQQQVKRKKKDHAKDVIRVNRDILGKLLSISSKLQSPIDFRSVLCYPLCPVPLSLAFPDGTKRGNTKSQLIDIILPSSIPDPGDRTCCTLIVDLIAQFRITAKGKSKTFAQLITKLLSSLPKGHNRVDLVADCYREFSIKAGEREKRGASESQRILIKSFNTLIPSDLNGFYSNGENKTQLIKLTFEFIKANAKKCLDILNCNAIIMSGDEYCEKVTIENVLNVENLVSNQEEADTKVVLHAMDALECEGNVCIRSPSGDTDILVIAVGLLAGNSRVLIDTGNGDGRKKIWLDSITLTPEQQNALIGFHAFTGNDYVSAFFRKSKQICWDKMNDVNNDWTEIFASLGDEWILSNDQKSNFEKFVCHLYSTNKSCVNDARFKIFEKKHLKSKQVADLSLIPPCLRTFLFHLERTNFVAKLWKSSGTAMIDLPSPTQHGWTDDWDILWTDEMFPDSMNEYVVSNEDDDDEDDFEDDIEGDIFEDSDEEYSDDEDIGE